MPHVLPTVVACPGPAPIDTLTRALGMCEMLFLDWKGRGVLDAERLRIVLQCFEAVREEGHAAAVRELRPAPRTTAPELRAVFGGGWAELRAPDTGPSENEEDVHNRPTEPPAARPLADTGPMTLGTWGDCDCEAGEKCSKCCSCAAHGGEPGDTDRAAPLFSDQSEEG